MQQTATAAVQDGTCTCLIESSSTVFSSDYGFCVFQFSQLAHRMHFSEHALVFSIPIWPLVTQKSQWSSALMCRVLIMGAHQLQDLEQPLSGSRLMFHVLVCPVSYVIYQPLLKCLHHEVQFMCGAQSCTLLHIYQALPLKLKHGLDKYCAHASSLTLEQQYKIREGLPTIFCSDLSPYLQASCKCAEHTISQQLQKPEPSVVPLTKKALFTILNVADQVGQQLHQLQTASLTVSLAETHIQYIYDESHESPLCLVYQFWATLKLLDANVAYLA